MNRKPIFEWLLCAWHRSWHFLYQKRNRRPLSQVRLIPSPDRIVFWAVFEGQSQQYKSLSEDIQEEREGDLALEQERCLFLPLSMGKVSHFSKSLNSSSITCFSRQDPSTGQPAKVGQLLGLTDPSCTLFHYKPLIFPTALVSIWWLERDACYLQQWRGFLSTSIADKTASCSWPCSLQFPLGLSTSVCFCGAQLAQQSGRFSPCLLPI